MLNSGESEAGLVYLVVIHALLNVGASIKSNAEVVLDGGKLFVCHFDDAATKHVHLVLLDHFSPFQGFLIEHRCLNQGALVVDQIYAHDLSLALLVLVGSHCGLLDNSRFNVPVLAILVQKLYRQIVV